MSIMITETTMMVRTAGMWKIKRAAVMPMNSVMRVSQLTRERSRNENQPQKEPKASKIASA